MDKHMRKLIECFQDDKQTCTRKQVKKLIKKAAKVHQRNGQSQDEP